MSIREIVLKNRSYRRFLEKEPVSREHLLELIDLARNCPSGSNIQPLKYFVSCDPQTNAKIFPCLAWAGYLRDWGGPQEGERPSAYVIILGDLELRGSCGSDVGIAAQTIMLGAAEMGLGGCMVGSVQRDPLRGALHIPERYDILLVLALGKPAEKVVLEELKPGGSIEYYRTPDDVHHVPKRPLSEIVINN